MSCGSGGADERQPGVERYGHKDFARRGQQAQVYGGLQSLPRTYICRHQVPLSVFQVHVSVNLSLFLNWVLNQPLILCFIEVL